MKERRFSINRVTAPSDYRLIEVIHGLENSTTLQQLFDGKEKLQKALFHTKLKAVQDGYGVWFERNTAKIYINTRFLNKARDDYLYLDMVHVLVHLKQFLDGKDCNESVEYVDRTTEIEAYKYTVEEARAIGFKTKDILAYLRFETSDEEFRKLVEKIGIRKRR